MLMEVVLEGTGKRYRAALASGLLEMYGLSDVARSGKSTGSVSPFVSSGLGRFADSKCGGGRRDESPYCRNCYTREFGPGVLR